MTDTTTITLTRKQVDDEITMLTEMLVSGKGSEGDERVRGQIAAMKKVRAGDVGNRRRDPTVPTTPAGTKKGVAVYGGV